MERDDIRMVVDYIARNHRCTFPSAWDTGEGVEVPVTFSRPSPEEAAASRTRRDALVDEIAANLSSQAPTERFCKNGQPNEPREGEPSMSRTTREELIETAKSVRLFGLKCAELQGEGLRDFIWVGDLPDVIDAILAKLSEQDEGRVERAAQAYVKVYAALSPALVTSGEGHRQAMQAALDAAGPYVVERENPVRQRTYDLLDEWKERAERAEAANSNLITRNQKQHIEIEDLGRKMRDAQGQADLFRHRIQTLEAELEATKRELASATQFGCDELKRADELADELEARLEGQIWTLRVCENRRHVERPIDHGICPWCSSSGNSVKFITIKVAEC